MRSCNEQIVSILLIQNPTEQKNRMRFPAIYRAVPLLQLCDADHTAMPPHSINKNSLNPSVSLIVPQVSINTRAVNRRRRMYRQHRVGGIIFLTIACSSYCGISMITDQHNAHGERTLWMMCFALYMWMALCCRPPAKRETIEEKITKEINLCVNMRNDFQATIAIEPHVKYMCVVSFAAKYRFNQLNALSQYTQSSKCTFINRAIYLSFWNSRLLKIVAQHSPCIINNIGEPYIINHKQIVGIWFLSLCGEHFPSGRTTNWIKPIFVLFF